MMLSSAKVNPGASWKLRVFGEEVVEGLKGEKVKG